MWYTREEALRRFAVFFNSVTLAGAFGGLLASGIENMNGIRGYAGWRWIFILEGILTYLLTSHFPFSSLIDRCRTVVAFLSYFVIVDFPEDAKWLTEDEREFMRARLITENDTTKEPISFKAGLKSYFSDYKAYIAALLYFGKLSNPFGYSQTYSISIQAATSPDTVSPTSSPPLSKVSNTPPLKPNSTPSPPSPQPTPSPLSYPLHPPALAIASPLHSFPFSLPSPAWESS